MNINKEIKRDIVISIVEGRGELVGIHFIDEPLGLLLEAEPEVADKIVELWNSQLPKAGESEGI